MTIPRTAAPLVVTSRRRVSSLRAVALAARRRAPSSPVIAEPVIAMHEKNLALAPRRP
jgi:hypothetical protein